MKKYAFEFFSIFIAVIAAFSLNNWNDNRRDDLAEEKILLEIKKGLKKDLDDIETNVLGHKNGIKSCKTFRSIILNKSANQDSLQLKYIQLTRDFTSLQNVSGYETLKSRGLELIESDSLRSDLISLYEYDYYTLKKLEEDYEEMQFHRTYFKEINKMLAPNFIFDVNGNIIKVKTPILLSEADKNVMLSYLVKIQINRLTILSFYDKVKKHIKDLEIRIDQELKN